MYRRSLTSLKVALAGCFALGGVLPFATVPNTPVAKAAAMAFGYEEGASRMATYQQADGSSAYALSLQAQLPASQNAQSQVMILVDTSASQKGLFQEDSLAVAKSILEGLNPEDKVQLVAVDLDAIAMNQGFIAPQSQAMEAALENLSKRTPLGTTDIERVFNWASEQFAAVPNTQPKHLIYIGDGICNASMLGSNRFDKMVANLQERRLPVSSFAIGPERNIEVLSILANQTGGNILIDSDESGAQDLAASDLVNSVRTNVFWPTDIDSSGQINETFPAAAVPLRADRDSILLGTLNSDSAFKLTMQGEVNGEKVTQQWSVQPQASDEQFAFLGYVIDQARKDQGLRLPTVGSEGLREMARIVNVANKSLYSLAGDALRDGNSNAARTLVTAAVKRDPTDPRASEFRSILQEEDAPADDFAAAENAGGDQLIGQTDMLQKAYAQQLSTFVRNEIRMANRQMSVNPESVVTRLKEVMNQVQAAADAPQDIRTNLVNSLDVALSTAQGQLVEYRDLEEQRAKAEATAANRMETLASMEDQQKKVVRMVDQFQGLLNDIDYTRDFKEFSVIADNIKESAQLLDETYPNTPIAASVRSNSHTQSVFQSGKIRRQKFLDMVYALDSVEESGVPFDDRNPIRYPDAEEWHEKKLLRKKYERVALLEEGGNEQQILAALERTYDLPPANGIPLSEFVEQLRDAYGINIRIDNRALEEESVDPDEPVEFNLSGIRLSSALKIILDEMNLTYQVRDEVLTITTTTDAEEKQVTLVYDVADLVLPLFSIGGGGGGLGGGGGGFGGGGGGFGGAGGGGLGGGGLGGGGLGGGGGGLFNVTDDEVEAKQDEAVQPIQIESTGNLKEDWNRHFANNYEEPQRILVTVKELMSRPQLAKAEFEQLSAILEAAIRNDQAQPWMYQGLFVAQSGLGAPKAETERLMMSILDNDSSPVTALNVATFMANNGMEARSLTILRDLVDAQPVWAKPLEVAIKAVKAERNTADIQWVTTAILSQAWPDNPTIVKDALLLARATISELKKSGQTTEAAGFERQLVDSLERDCLVRVSWTGDADLDLVVEEPNGTVCSHIQPRTMGGGVMMQDAFAGFDNGKGKVYSEYYVLPKGFSGDYRVYIRNVTGKLAGGKATVEIFRNFRSDNQTSQAKEVEFGDNDVYAINFKLEEGRRTDETDSLLTAVGSELLAAERNAIMDKVEDQFGPYQGSTGNTGSSEGSRVARNRNRGINRRGVGYQPQITSIPSGPSWSGLAFTSYDRMYVFVNGAPNFIEVVDVDTFTFAGTGNNGGGGGLGGGLGGGGGGLGGGLGGGGLGGGGGGLGGGLF